MLYQLDIERRATKDFRKLPGHVQERAKEAVRALSEQPRPDGCKLLKVAEAYRIRVGNYRILYTVDDAAQLVTVLRVQHRSEVYKNF